MDMPEEIAVYKRADQKYEFATYDTPLNHEWVSYTRTTKYDELKALCERMAKALGYCAQDPRNAHPLQQVPHQVAIEALQEYTNFMKDKS